MSRFKRQNLAIHRYYLPFIILVSLLALTFACTLEPKDIEPGQVVAANTSMNDAAGFPTLSYNIDTSVSALVRFVDLVQDGTIHAKVDTVSDLPMASVLVESSNSHLPLGLEADGLLVAINSEPHDTTPYHVELKWTPWHGNGRYVLNLQLLDWQNSTIPSSQVLVVNVIGIPENVPNVRSRFIELYRDNFGLNLTAPAFAHYSASDQTPDKVSRWVSTAYIENHLYEIDIPDHEDIISSSYVINSDENVGFCRPLGTIRMLAVIVDYGNTDLDPVHVEAALQAGLEEARVKWADISHQIGLSVPIIQLELTTSLYKRPPPVSRYVTPAEINSASGLDPADFDLLVEIDLDKENTTTGEYDGVGVSLGDGCRPLGSRGINIAFNVRDLNSMQNAMPRSIFEHELIHSMGWMHWWPNQSGDGLSWVHSREGWEPWLLFGWTDLDGDGILEIMDSTPYGLIQ